MANYMYTDLDLGGVSKLLNVPSGTQAGELVEYQQLMTALQSKLDVSKIVTDIEATAGNVPDAPTIKSAIATAVANLVGSAPETLDTIQEIADALGDDANFVTTITTALGTKVAKSDVATDIENATAGQVPDAMALHSYLESHFVDVHNYVVNFVSNTDLEITHNCNKDYRDFMINIVASNGQNISTFDRNVHPTDPMNKLYLRLNSGSTNAHVMLIC